MVLRKRKITHLTHLSPVLHNTTMWSGKYEMIKRFTEINDQLLLVVDKERATVTIDRSLTFKRSLQKYCKMLGETNSVTNLLQRKRATLSECRLNVDSLLRVIETYRSNEVSILYGCRLSGNYLDIDSDISLTVNLNLVLLKCSVEIGLV